MKNWVKSLIGVIIFVVILMYFVYIYPRGDWQKEYRASVDLGQYEFYTGTSSDFDYLEPDVQGVINYLLSISNSPEEYVRNVGEFIYYNIRYDFTLVEDPAVLERHCVENSASDILRLRRGVCVTQAKLAVALLRGGGVMAKPSVGCLKEPTCEPMSESFGAFQIYEDETKRDRKPIIAPIRQIDGRYLIAGGVHAWTEVYLPEHGWIISEPTTGLMFEPDCQDYWKSTNPLDALDLCHMADEGFVNQCILK